MYCKHTNPTNQHVTGVITNESWRKRNGSNFRRRRRRSRSTRTTFRSNHDSRVFVVDEEEAMGWRQGQHGYQFSPILECIKYKYQSCEQWQGMSPSLFTVSDGSTYRIASSNNSSNSSNDDDSSTTASIANERPKNLSGRWSQTQCHRAALFGKRRTHFTLECNRRWFDHYRYDGNR